VIQTLKELEEAIAMVKEDDSKKKHGPSKFKKEKEPKEKDKDKDKEGLFGLFHHKKGMCARRRPS
jgi:ribosomal protein L12E/L44/L45/RPP1/RPP2